MKFLRSWLEEYIELNDISSQELAAKITAHSSEVESVEQIQDYFDGKVVIGKIKNTRKHPNADRLQVFEVQIGNDKEVTIVSAAPNARDGIIVPVALVGANLPGMVIAERAMRGVSSFGMCCGKSELMQEREFSTGLWELNCSEEQLGKSICELYPDLFPIDTLFDIKILPDRIGNIGNYIGLAIEVARILGRTNKLKGLAYDVYHAQGITPVHTLHRDEKRIDFSDPTGLSHVFDVFRTQLNDEYLLPLSIKRQLFLTGAHFVNPLSDLSNYITAVTGQPVHFFDTKSVFGEQEAVSWRFESLAHEEEFKGLGNLKKTILPAQTIVLKQENTILTIPALTGGESTKVTDDTRDVLIEIPDFDSNLTMRNAFLVKYRSEGSKIWASRSHPARIPLALQIIREQLGLPSVVTLSKNGETDNLEWQDHKQTFGASVELAVNWQSIGEKFNHGKLIDTITRFEPYIRLLGSWDNTTLTVHNQAYNFVEDEDTLLTELTNLSGINDVQGTHLQTQQIPPYYDKEFFAITHFRNLLRQEGYDEIITRPFVENGTIKVLKSQNAHMNYLRTELWPSLLEVAAKNVAAGIEHIRIFELNRVFLPHTNDIDQPFSLTLVVDEENPYQLTQLIEKISVELGHVWRNIIVSQEITSRGNTIEYHLGDLVVCLTEVSNATKKEFSLPLKKHWWIIETKIESFVRNQTEITYQDTSQFPSLIRDYNITFPEPHYWNNIYNTISSIQLPFETKIHPIDILQKDGKSKVTIRVTITDHTTTPNSKHIEQFEAALKSKIASSDIHIAD